MSLIDVEKFRKLFLTILETKASNLAEAYSQTQTSLNEKGDDIDLASNDRENVLSINRNLLRS